MLDLVFPSQCAVCGRHCPTALCGPCALLLTRRTVAGSGDLAARGCSLAFESFRAAGDYSGPIREMVLRLKDSERRMASVLASLMLVAAGNEPGYLFPAALCYVPSTREKVARRGYNQSRLLALALSELTGAPVLDALTVVTKPSDQDALAAGSRWANVAGAFAPTLELPRRALLLVDDVITTGATADACSSALIEGGAASVRVLAAARAVLRRGRPPKT